MPLDVVPPRLLAWRGNAEVGRIPDFSPVSTLHNPSLWSSKGNVMRLGSGLVAVLLAVACGIARAQVPLPTDLSIQLPGGRVPAAYPAFSGAWGNGAWTAEVGPSLIPTALVVARVASDGTAQVIYAGGAGEHLKTTAHWLRLTGHIENDRLTIQLPDPNSPWGFRVQYWMIGPGRLEGDMTNSEGWRGHAFLQRIAGPPTAIIATAALPFRPIWQEILIPEHSSVGVAAGQAIQLAATLYRTRLPGRQPLVILNHGSTAPDKVKRTLYFQAGARFFLAHGYCVVVPMRKGRGNSGGPYLEPGNQGIPTAIQVESAVEDEDAVVNAMRAEPWVDPARIIVAGHSRGGFLSVIYAARYPEKVAGVINFNGGWWGERSEPGSKENSRYLAAAGKTARVKELWLYADYDPYYSLAYTRKNFDAFRANGGSGDFVAYKDVPGIAPGEVGNGHALFGHVDMWEGAVAAYLRQISGG
jgi:dienelactone hydrolase